ncbi:hypothetical protein U1Q18_035463 [Sarracenia purpurea var. burkii]
MADEIEIPYDSILEEAHKPIPPIQPSPLSPVVRSRRRKRIAPANNFPGTVRIYGNYDRGLRSGSAAYTQTPTNHRLE